VVFSEAREQLMELIRDSRSLGAARGETLLKRTDGTPLPVSVSLNRMCFEDFEGVCAVITDLTEQKRVEEELRRHRAELEFLVSERTAELQQEIIEHERAEETLRVAQSEAERYGAEMATLMDALPAAVFIAHDVECRYMSGSRYIQELLGLPATANISKSAPPPERHNNFRPMKDGLEIPLDELPVQMAAKGREIRDYEFELLFDDGDSRHLLGNATPLRNVEGEIYGSVGAFVDITERKRAEEELHKAKEEAERRAKELAALMDAVPALIWVTRDTECLSMTGNRVVYEFLGMPTGANVSKTAPEGERPLHFRALRNGMEVPPDELPMQRAAKGEGMQDYELEYVFGDGTSKITLGNTTPLYDATGHVYGAIAAFVDITERKRMEEELRKSRDELELRVEERTSELSATIERLELLNRELQEFAYVASHDLQEPLRKIQTFCEMAQKRCAPVLDTTGKDYLDRVVNSASRIRQLLRDLLDFSRAAAKSEPLKKIDLVRIVLDAADVFEPSIKETGCKIEIENIPAIEADESQMSRLFQNLIGNSLKFRSGETPHIKVYGKLDGKRTCEIFVKDNGIGFDPQYAELIFKPFQKLHGRNEYDGTGMGLAICRKIVERHGGSIRAESEPGKGSTFIIRLPVKQDRLEGI
jgi:signal transduction histidine kinase